MSYLHRTTPALPEDQEGLSMKANGGVVRIPPGTHFPLPVKELYVTLAESWRHRLESKLSHVIDVGPEVGIAGSIRVLLEEALTMADPYSA